MKNLKVDDDIWEKLSIMKITKRKDRVSDIIRELLEDAK